MTRKRLVLLVEGEGDVDAAPELCKRLLAEQGGFDAVILDDAPLRVGEFARLVKNDCSEWKRFLSVVAKRKNLGGCVLLLDGDSRVTVGGTPFCVVPAARHLAHKAVEVGAGAVFSVAVVFACMEFESWLIAGAASLAGRPLSDRRAGLPNGLTPPEGDLEQAPRDAKGWFRKHMTGGYSPTRDQAELARIVDMQSIRDRPMRSFRHFENALRQITDAFRSGRHIVTPSDPADA